MVNVQSKIGLWPVINLSPHPKSSFAIFAYFAVKNLNKPESREWRILIDEW
jgi:hypothetical protein